MLTGEHLQRGRIYDPLAARFVSHDPILQAPFSTQGANPYSYVFNDPVNNADPTGLFAMFGIFAGYPAGAVLAAGWAGLAASAGTSVGSAFRGTYFGGNAPSTSVRSAGSLVPQNNGSVGPRQAAPTRPGSNIGTIPCNGTPEECRAKVLEFNLGGGFGPGGVVTGGAQAGRSLLGRLFGWLFGKGATSAGVSLSRAVEAGLVKQGSKLFNVLQGIEKGFAAAAPKTATQALSVVKSATQAVGLEPGVATIQKSGAIVLENVGGVTTTLGNEGSILVKRGADTLLQLLP